MIDREAIAAAIHEHRRRKAPLTISLGYYDLDPEDQAALLALADDVIAALGIPAATLRGLRDGSLVAVPREPTQEMATAGVRAMRAPRLHVSHRASDDIMTVFVVFTAMLAAAQEPPR